MCPSHFASFASPREKASPGERILHLPAVRDKIAQQAVRQVLEPTLDAGFLDCSYGYRLGKGPARAIARVSHYIGSMKRRRVATGDVDDCFDSIDPVRLEVTLTRRIEDSRVVRLMMLWCAMGAVSKSGRWRDAVAGVHQGNVLAPLLANLYLHAFDEAMTKAGFGLVRYADDFVLLARTRDDAQRAAAAARYTLANSLGLRLNDDECAVRDLEQGFTFLGIRFRGTTREVDAGKLTDARLRLATLAQACGNKGLPSTVTEYNATVLGWRHYYGTLLRADELVTLDRVAEAGLEGIARAARADLGLSRAEVEEGLVGAELLALASLEERRRRARRLAHDEPAVAPKRERDATSASGKNQPGKQSNPPSIARTVRARKRRHLVEAETGSTLLVNTAGTYIGKSMQAIVVRKERKEVARVQANRLRAITVASRGVSLSEDAIELCAQRGVPVVFVSPWGEVRAIASAPGSLDAECVTSQCAASSCPDRASTLAAAIVEGKVRNQARLARYWGKYHRKATTGFAELLDQYEEVVGKVIAEIPATIASGTLQERRHRLMGAEGRAAAAYWPIVASVLGAKQTFDGRERQGAKDLVNSLLNYGYAVLQSRVHVALMQAGLLPEVGFLHSARRRAPVLVFDMMEEFRAPVVDRAVVTLLSLRRPAEQDPDHLLTRETRTVIVDAVTRRLGATVAYGGKDVTLGEVIEHQARRLARAVSGEEGYRSFASAW